MHLTIFHYYGDENPNAIRIIQLSNRTTVLLLVSREYVNEFKKLPESTHQGVYILLEEEVTELNRLPRLYVGECQNIGERLYNQRTDKEWWDTAIICCAKDNCIDRFNLEKKLYEKATEAGKCDVENLNTPKGSPLVNVGEIWVLDQFLKDIEFLLDSLGIDALKKQETSVSHLLSDNAIVFEQTHIQSLNAKMIIINGEYVVLRGSLAAKEEQKSCPESIKNERKRLVEQGILKFDEVFDLYVFKSDTKFKSPTRAGQIIYGANFPGRIGWTYKLLTLKECEEKGLI